MAERGRGEAIFESGHWEVDFGRREFRSRGAPVPLGGRTFDVIEVLVRSAGALVTKADLMARVWPGVTVEDNTLQVHISAVRRALGADRGLLRTASGRGYRLLGDWRPRSEKPRAAAAEITPLNTPPPQPGNLPAAGSDLIGRSASVQHVDDLLSAYRAVTLTGPGGIGKTRLALEVARGQVARFGGECWLVELAALADPALVSSAVAGALDLALGAELISPASVARAIGARKLLLVLDNCEHVVDAAAELAELLIRQCPGLSLLATSRELLRIDGEYAYRVPPLDVPRQVPLPSGAMLEHSAVQLFVARTQALQAGRSPPDANLPAIAAICRRLDGIPLAIELAAARAATLGLEEVLTRLDDRFALLTGGRRTALPRHQTLRATLDWSYQLLPESERRLLRFLAIFAGGFTVEAATAITADQPGTAVSAAAASVVDGIANLVAKSLIVLDGPDLATRWRLLETTRAYALEKLTQSGEADLAARRHAAFFTELVGPAALPMRLQPSIEDLSRNGREIDNVRAALDWAFSAAGDPVLGIILTAAYVPTWIHLSLMVESRGRAERALERLEAEPNPGPGPEAEAGLSIDTRLRMQLRIALGTALLHSTGAEGSIGTVLAKALEVADELDDVDGQLRLLWALWSYRFNKGEQTVALPLADRFRQVVRRSGTPAEILVGDRLMGLTMHYGGNQPGARGYLDRVHHLPMPISDPRQWVWFHHDQRLLARAMLARVLWLQGFVDQARELAQSCVEDAQAIDHKLALCYALAEAVCPIAIMTGDFAAAAQASALLTHVVTRHGVTLWKSMARCLEGEVLIKRGDAVAGTIVLGQERDSFVKTWRMTRLPEILCILAEGLAAIGQGSAARATVDEALARSEQDGQRWCVPELRRVRGELLLQQGGQDDAAAEADFMAAIAEARLQGALFWELRAALSLARLRLRHDRGDEARACLAPVCARFTEGFATADLRDALALLDALPPGRAVGEAEGVRPG